jgi:hypothetical protein
MPERPSPSEYRSIRPNDHNGGYVIVGAKVLGRGF